MTLVNRLDGFQSIIESAKAQVSGSANTQLVEELSQVGAFLKDIADLTNALEVQGNITQSNPDILALTTLLTGNIARVLKPALEAQSAPVAVQAQSSVQAQFDANLAAQANEDALTADIQRQIAEQQGQQAQAWATEAQKVRAAQPAPTGIPTQAEVQYRPAPQATPYVATPYPAGLASEAEVQAYQQPAPQVVVGSQPAPTAPVAGGKDLTADFRAQIAGQTQQPAPVAQPTPQPTITETVQAEDPLTASIRAQVNGQATSGVQAHVVPAATQTQAVTPAQSAMQQLFDAKLNEVRSGQ